MRVLVDTSVWVEFLNGFDSPEADALASCLADGVDVVTCGPVDAGSITVRALMDCLIATLAAKDGARLLAKDNDMRHILESGLLELSAAPLP